MDSRGAIVTAATTGGIATATAERRARGGGARSLGEVDRSVGSRDRPPRSSEGRGGGSRPLNVPHTVRGGTAGGSVAGDSAATGSIAGAASGRSASGRSGGASAQSSSGKRPASAAASRRPQYFISRTFGDWQRASVCGRVRRPKLESDEGKLRELLAQCRAGNFREVRALVTHFPYLLSLTDNYGLGPLHHAALSCNPDFVTQVLELYRHPRCFITKAVTYETEGELQTDMALGLEVCAGQAALDARPSVPLGTAVVQHVGEGGLAASAGVMPGDTLEAVLGTGLFAARYPAPLGAQDVLEDVRRWSGFPVTLEFRGSAGAEILSRDGWTPSHVAAIMVGNEGARQILERLVSEQVSTLEALDAGGRTPKECLRLAPGPGRRRPLSAGPSRFSAAALPVGQPGSARPGSSQPGSVLLGRLAASRERPLSAFSTATCSGPYAGCSDGSLATAALEGCPGAVAKAAASAAAGISFASMAAATAGPAGAVVPADGSGGPPPPPCLEVPFLTPSAVRSLPCFCRPLPPPRGTGPSQRSGLSVC